MGRGRSQPGRVDAAVVARDAELLDALGRGAPAPAGDELAAALAGWRDDVAEGVPAVEFAAIDALAGVPPVACTPPSYRPCGRRAPLVRVMAAGVAAGVLVLAALGLAAAFAGPDSPLWPITRVLYAQRADSQVAQRAAERAIEQARTAIAQGRYDVARSLLDAADGQIARVRDAGAAGRLRGEVAVLRRLLPGTRPVPSGTGTPGGAAGSTPGPGGPAPAGPSGGGGVPGLPAPSLPGLPLPTALPSVPVPGLSGGGVPGG